MHRGTTLNFLFGLLLALSILGALPVAQGAVGITQAHIDAVRNEEGQDPGAPFGTWTNVVETTTWYLKRDTPLSLQDSPPGTGDVNEAYYLDYERPTAGLRTTKVPEQTIPAPDPVGAVTIGGDQVVPDLDDPNDKKVRMDNRQAVAVPMGPSVVPGGVQRAFFIVPPQLTQTEDVRVYTVQFQFYLHCAVPTTGPVSTFYAGGLSALGMSGQLAVLDFKNGAWTPRINSNGRTFEASVNLAVSTGHLPTDGVYLVEGTATVGSLDQQNGVLVEAREGTHPGTRLQIGLTVGQNQNPVCFLHFDSANYPSNVRIGADSGRLNLWAENLNGDFTQGLKSAQRGSSEERQFVAQVVHADAWPKLNGYLNPRPEALSPCGASSPQCGAAAWYDGIDSATSTEPKTPVDYQDDFWDLNDFFDDDSSPQSHTATGGPGQVLAASNLDMRIRDMNQLTFVQATDDDRIQGTDVDKIKESSRTLTKLGDSVNRIEYLYSYPPSLPDGSYRIEAFSNVQGFAMAPQLTTGLKGFTFEVLGGTSHAVNPGEPTEFRMRVRNIGAEDDAVTVTASPPGNSWTAGFVGGSTNRLKANGGQAEVVLRVTPSPSAASGASQVISVVASSANFPNEVQPIDKQVTVTVQSSVVHLVDLTATKSLLVIQPGVDTNLAGLRIENKGTAADTFTLQAVVPSGVTGWTFQSLPLSQQIAAASSADFSLRVRAPVDAPAGQAFTLALVASRLGDAATTDRLDLAVSVQVVHGVDITAKSNPISLRRIEACPPAAPDQTEAPFACGDIRDSDADRSALFHVRLRNPSAVTDTYTLRGSWKLDTTVNGVGISALDGNSDCDGANGVPEYWRYDFGNATQVVNSPDRAGGFTASYTLGPNAVEDLYLELGTIAGECPDFIFFGSPLDTGETTTSPAAAFSIVARSVKDPGREKTLTVGAYLTDTGAFEGNNDYGGAVHLVGIVPDDAQPDVQTVTQPGTKSTHLFRASNLGNEKDRVLVQVPAGTDGWTRQLQYLGSIPASVSCSATSAVRVVCTNVGVHDELRFRLNVTPAANKPIGQVDRALVTVSSGDDGAIAESLEFVTSTVGTFQFDAQAIASSVTGEKGKTALLPFVLKNQGTGGDRLNLSLIQGDSTWTPRLGLPNSNFVPAGKELSGFISVTVPSDATAAKLFRLQVTSQGNGALDVMDFTVTPVSGGALRLAGAPSNVTTLAQTGVAKTVNVTVTEPAGTVGRIVKVDVLAGSMPNGWVVSPSTVNVTLAGSGNPTATASFQVTAPSTALANSRVPFLLRAASTSGSAVTGQANLLLQLADTFGVKLSPDGKTNQTVSPGAQVVYNATVANLGTSTDTIRLSTSGAPTGWLIQTDPPELALGPLENRSVQLLVRAPANAQPRTVAATTLQAVSLSSGAVSSFDVNTQVGFFELAVNGTSGVLSLAPTETVSRVYTVHNNGTVHDEVVVTPSLLSAALSPQVTMKAEPAVVSLDPNETRQVRVDFTLGAAPPSNSDIATKVLFASRLAPTAAPANATLAGTLHVLRYVALDADGDGIGEHAVDRDGDAGNGYESYLDTGAGGGKASRLADLERFLTTEARAAKTVQVDLSNGTTVDVLRLAIDGDEDGLLDLFIDSSGDGQPDAYWDPDGAKRQDLSTVKDIDADAVPDYFVDTDLAAGLDRVYNLRTGDFTDLLSIDVDSDGTKDFVVDKNGNGALDADETVLYSKNGRLLTVQKVDMDGNGEDDSVFDTDGDGTPDYFIPAGEEDSVEIVLKDMNGDGQADWAYDADGDGRLDSYYDPATGETGLVDATSSFQQALKDYWYIPALFGVVLVLFVVLLIVTRR